MNKLRKFFSRFSDIKTRTLFILVAVVVLVIVGLVLTSMREAQPPEVSAEVRAANIGEITSLPGTGAYNEEYAKLQLAENERKAQEAAQSGDAAIPRLINQADTNNANLSFGSELCAECIYSPDGYDQYGYDAKGFDKSGYDAEGYDKDGYNKDGFDRNGCDRDGLDKDGIPCYDAAGYSADGYDKNGFDKDGFNQAGYDKDGFDRNGFDKDGFDKNGFDKDGFDRNGCNREGLDRNGQPCAAQNQLIVPQDTAANSQEAYRRLLEEQQKARQAQVSAEQAAQDQARSLAEQQAMQQAFEALLQSQSMSVTSTWQPPTQMYVKGVAPVTTGGEGEGTGTGGANDAGPILYKAGSVVFAVLDTALNSDEPGPVLATIVQGPLEGSKVLGDLELLEDKLMLRFSLLSSPDLPESLPFNAVAIDAETARTALATGVDNHYFLRYGSLFASAFLEGMGEAILAGITQPVLEVDNEVLVVQSADVTTGQALLVGLGTLGQKWGQHLGEVFNKAPTVTVDSGTGIGLLFLQDFHLNEGAAPMPVPPQNEMTQASMTRVNQQQNAPVQ